MSRKVEVRGPQALFIWLAAMLLTMAAAAASWGVLWRAWGWAFGG